MSRYDFNYKIIICINDSYIIFIHLSHLYKLYMHVSQNNLRWIYRMS